MRLFEAAGSHRLKLGEASGGSERGLSTQGWICSSCLGGGNRQGSAAASARTGDESNLGRWEVFLPVAVGLESDDL